MAQICARKAAGKTSCTVLDEHRTWTVYPHQRAENLSPFGGKEGVSALLPTGGSSGFALNDSMING